MTEKIIETVDEINMLDMLVTLSESWKVLVLGPIFAGVFATIMILIWPKTFESVAIVRLNEEEVALYAAPVLDPLIEKFGLLVEADGIMDDARQELKKRIAFSVDKKTKLATITFKARTSEAAQTLGNSVMEALLIELQPKGKEKEAIIQEIAINNEMIANGVYLAERQSGKLSNAGNISNMNTPNGQIINLKLNNLELNLRLKTKGREVFVQEPNLPQRYTSMKISVLVPLVVLLTLGLISSFVCVRRVVQIASRNEESAHKFKVIKKNLTWSGNLTKS